MYTYVMICVYVFEHECVAVRACVLVLLPVCLISSEGCSTEQAERK